MKERSNNKWGGIKPFFCTSPISFNPIFLLFNPIILDLFVTSFQMFSKYKNLIYKLVVYDAPPKPS